MTTTIPGYYGEAPVDLGPLWLTHWHEFMHYLYLPIRVPVGDLRSVPEGVQRMDGRWCRIPDALWFMHDAVTTVLADAAQFDHLYDPYVYITARRGFATPGNPLNRPGWHCDDFGGDDLNYIWSDRWPTRLLLDHREPDGRGIPVGDDDVKSMEEMAFWARQAVTAASVGANHACTVEDAPAGHLLRLSPYVIHDTPVIPEPGGMRSFFKISVSSHRYNLLGNSHNYLLDYDWKMYDRAVIRNQPGGNADHYEEPSHV